MSDWPTAPMIRVVRGYRTYYGPIENCLAFRFSGGSYLLLTDGVDEGYLHPNRGDRISEWVDLAVVPVATLKSLRDEFRGVAEGSAGLDGRRLAVPLEVISHLPGDKPSPLTRAVSQVEALLRTPRLAPDAPSETHLAQLLGALADLPGTDSDSKPQVLATIAQICVEWVAAVAPSYSPLSDPAEVLCEGRARVESDPSVGEFSSLAALAGDAATWVGEDQHTEEGRMRLTAGLAEPVLTSLQYALAQLAGCLEDGEC